SADLTSQQGEVEDGLHIRDSIAVLCNPHCPGADHALGFHGDIRGLPYQLARDSAALDNALPAFVPDIPRECIEAFRVVVDEIVRENLSAGPLVLGEHLLHDSLEQRNVAIDTDGKE